MTIETVRLLERELLAASLADLPREITAERFLDIAKQASDLEANAQNNYSVILRRRLELLRRRALIRHAAL